ncbi:MAG: hypothetical protein ACRD19_12530 [Terriglobia bacterium]
MTRPLSLLAIAVVATDFTTMYVGPRSPAGSILHVLPDLLMIFLVVAWVQEVREMDEMLQRIHTQVASIAFLLTAILIFAFDGLESAGIYRATRSTLETTALLIYAATLIFFGLRHR